MSEKNDCWRGPSNGRRMTCPLSRLPPRRPPPHPRPPRPRGWHEAVAAAAAAGKQAFFYWKNAAGPGLCALPGIGIGDGLVPL